jgi:hypothetical protein
LGGYGIDPRKHTRGMAHGVGKQCDNGLLACRERNYYISACT